MLATYQYCAHLLDDVNRAPPAGGRIAEPADAAATEDIDTSTVQLSWLLLLFSLLCLAPQAFFTYFYGYHSIQQILLGAIVVRGPLPLLPRDSHPRAPSAHSSLPALAFNRQGCFYYGGVLQLWARHGARVVRLLDGLV